MKTKKYYFKKTIYMLMIILATIAYIGFKTPVYAGDLSWSSINSKAQNFIDNGQDESTISQQKVENDLKPLAQILMGIAVLVLLSVGAILGVKYMIAGANERANIKEKLIWYVVAAVLVFGAVSIFNIVVSILNKVSD